MQVRGLLWNAVRLSGHKVIDIFLHLIMVSASRSKHNSELIKFYALNVCDSLNDHCASIKLFLKEVAGPSEGRPPGIGMVANSSSNSDAHYNPCLTSRVWATEA